MADHSIDRIDSIGRALTDGHPTAKLLCELSAAFYSLNWNMGTGGGVSVQDGDLIFLTPSGVHKERIVASDLFVYDARDESYIYEPSNRQPSASSPLFLWLHRQHGAGAVIHTHSISSNLVTNLGEVWSIQNQEYIKGIPRYSTQKMLSNSDTLEVPVIHNQATEDMLLPDLIKALMHRPDAACVLVKNHGAYHFAKDIWKCKAQAECMEYLFDLSWKLRSL